MKGPKKGLALLLEGPSDEEGAPESDEMEAGFDDAAKAVWEAVKADDADAFGVALKRAIYACHDEE